MHIHTTTITTTTTTTTTTQLQYPSSISDSTSSPASSNASSRPWNPHPEDSSTEDEEEVVFDLDEAAMAQLPLHLQQNMREIQRERVRRLSQAPGYHDTYADRWVKNMMARVSNDQEMSVARGARVVDLDVEIGSPFGRVLEAADSNAGVYVAGTRTGNGTGVEHGMPASSGRYYSRSMSMSMSVSGRNVFLGCMGSFERNTLTRCTSGRQDFGEVLEDKFATDHVSEVNMLAEEEERMQQHKSKTGQFGKTIMSAVRVRVKKSFQKMSMLLRK